MTKRQPSVLVTGANGFLGSAIVQQLLTRGIAVRASDQAQQSIIGMSDYWPLDLAKRQQLTLVLRDMRYVVHVAGLAHQFRVGSHIRSAFFSLNAEAAGAMARAAAEAGVEHFVLVSSVAVYGSGHVDQPNEDTACRPDGVYAESKYEGERKVLEASQQTGMRVTILRMATIYGEGDPGNVARLMRLIDRGRFVWIGDGSNWKSLIHRDDAARACLSAAFRQVGGEAQTYNVAPSPVRMREVVAGVAEALGRRAPLLRMPAWAARSLLAAAAKAGPTRRQAERWGKTLEKWLGEDVFDGSKFRRDVGFEPAVSLQEGLCREVAWYRKTQGPIRQRKAA